MCAFLQASATSISLMICLSMDTIDDLILYFRSEEEHALDI